MFFVMSALLTKLSLLALCGVPASAVRAGDHQLQSGSAMHDGDALHGDFDSRGGFDELQSSYEEQQSDFRAVATKAALARRANARTGASMGAQANAVDSALLAKFSESSSSCTCVLWAQSRQHSKAPEVAKQLKCSKECYFACHEDLDHYISPEDATKLVRGAAELPGVAASCSREGKCECLSSKIEANRDITLAEAGRNDGKRRGVAHGIWNNKTYDGANECLKSCECEPHWRTPVCAQRWNWTLFLTQSQNQDCDSAEVGKMAGIGLKSCSLMQQFKFKVQDGEYKGELVQLDDVRSKRVKGAKVSLEVLKFEAPSTNGPSSDRKCTVTVGYGAKNSWTAHLSEVATTMWLWDVVDVHGEVRFTVNQVKSEHIKASWKVTKVMGDETEVKYWALEDEGDFSKQDGFQLVFYNDDENKTKKKKKRAAAKLERKWPEVRGGAADDDTSYFSVAVEPEEDAGLILVASVLIDKAVAKEQPTP